MEFKNPLKLIKDNVLTWWDVATPSIVAIVGLLAIALGKDASQVPGLVNSIGTLADSTLTVPEVAIDQGYALYQWILSGAIGIVGFGRSVVVAWKKWLFTSKNRSK